MSRQNILHSLGEKLQTLVMIVYFAGYVFLLLRKNVKMLPKTGLNSYPHSWRHISNPQEQILTKFCQIELGKMSFYLR